MPVPRRGFSRARDIGTESSNGSFESRQTACTLAFKDNYAAGTAFIVIRRSDTKGLQLTKPG